MFHKNPTTLKLRRVAALRQKDKAASPGDPFLYLGRRREAALICRRSSKGLEQLHAVPWHPIGAEAPYNLVARVLCNVFTRAFRATRT